MDSGDSNLLGLMGGQKRVEKHTVRIDQHRAFNTPDFEMFICGGIFYSNFLDVDYAKSDESGDTRSEYPPEKTRMYPKGKVSRLIRTL